MKKIIYNKKLLFSISVFFLSVLLLLIYILYQNINIHQPKLIVNEKKENNINPKVLEINKLHDENNDLVAWLQIDGTNIDYPVMYTYGLDYYLYKDFYKKHFNAGSLFIDKNNIIKPRDINIIIHGHNMKNKTMFHDLINYKDEKFYNEHKKISFYTLNEKEEYVIIAVFKSKIYNDDDNVFKYYTFYNTNNKDEYKKYIDNIKRLSLYKMNESVSYPDKLLTLSTCEYSVTNGRMVVVAKKIN